MANNYANISSATQTGKSGGYKPTLYFAPLSYFTTLQKPVPGATIGSSVSIEVAHIMAATKAVHTWDAKIHSVKHTSKSVGDEGAQELEHSVVYEILGDNPATFEQVKAMQNDQMVVFAKDADCLNNDSYIQIGNDCVPVTVAVEFDGKTTKEGQKVYTITYTSKAKAFYLATLDISA